MNYVIEIIVTVFVAMLAAFGIFMLFYEAISDVRIRRGILLQEGEGKSELELKLCEALDKTGEKCADGFIVLLPESSMDDEELAEVIRKFSLHCVYYY